jgi:hypothetical protein
MATDVRAIVSKGIDAMHVIHISNARSPVDATHTMRDSCWLNLD